MSVYIEKLKIDTGSHPVCLSIVDFILGDFSKRGFYFTDDITKTSVVKNLISKNLNDNEIFVGKQYNTAGIDIDVLLNNNIDIVVEIPVQHLRFFDISKLVELSKKNKIILTDLEEGNSYFFSWFEPSTNIRKNGDVDSFLKRNGFNINNVLFLTTAFDKVKFCKEIKILNFWVVITALCSPFVLDIINNNTQQKYIDLIKNKQYEKFAVFKNWKARKWRVVLLSLLNHKKLLDHIDWSLIGETVKMSVATDYLSVGEFKKEHFLKFTTPEWQNNNPYQTKIDTFFQDHWHNLPKFLNHDEKICNDMVIKTSEKDINKYKFSIDIETYTTMSEKLVKSFLLGYIPIVAYTSIKSRYIDQIKKLGFTVIDESFDNCDSIDEIVLKMCEKIENLYETGETFSSESIIENFRLCTDKELLASYISQPLINVFKK